MDGTYFFLFRLFCSIEFRIWCKKKEVGGNRPQEGEGRSRPRIDVGTSGSGIGGRSIGTLSEDEFFIEKTPCPPHTSQRRTRSSSARAVKQEVHIWGEAGLTIRRHKAMLKREGILYCIRALHVGGRG